MIDPITFSNLGIDKKWQQRLHNQFIENPTFVQKESIPYFLKRRDMIVQADTGTGKTLAFCLPILQNIQTDLFQIQYAIIVPTRELAIQIETVLRDLILEDPLYLVSLTGGNRKEQERTGLKNAQIMIGTFGRVFDHLRKGNINFKYLKGLVIDEADQMMVADFLEDIQLLYSKLPKKLHTTIYSATIPQPIRKLATSIMYQHLIITDEHKQEDLSTIEQFFIWTTKEKKYSTLLITLEKVNPFLAIIFCSSKKTVEELSEKLGHDSHKQIEILHGDLSKAKRRSILKDFEAMKIDYLISSDLSARGLDIDGVTHVINYDLPIEADYYIHRIGRTGRAQKQGVSITFITDEETPKWKRIEKRIHQRKKIYYDKTDHQLNKIPFEKMKNN